MGRMNDLTIPEPATEAKAWNLYPRERWLVNNATSIDNLIESARRLAFVIEKGYDASLPETIKEIIATVAEIDRPPVPESLDCPNFGSKRINADGTENFCNRNFPNRCKGCGLNPFLD